VLRQPPLDGRQESRCLGEGTHFSAKFCRPAAMAALIATGKRINTAKSSRKGRESSAQTPQPRSRSRTNQAISPRSPGFTGCPSCNPASRDRNCPHSNSQTGPEQRMRVGQLAGHLLAVGDLANAHESLNSAMLGRQISLCSAHLSPLS
jgi:hypothetical protein